MKHHPGFDFRPATGFGWRQGAAAGALSLVAAALALAIVCLAGAFLPLLASVLGP